MGLVTLPGTSLDQSDELARAVQETLMQHPEIVAIGRRTGRAEEDEHVQGVEASEIDLTLAVGADPDTAEPKARDGVVHHASARKQAAQPRRITVQ